MAHEPIPLDDGLHHVLLLLGAVEVHQLDLFQEMSRPILDQAVVLHIQMDGQEHKDDVGHDPHHLVAGLGGGLVEPQHPGLPVLPPRLVDLPRLQV